MWMFKPTCSPEFSLPSSHLAAFIAEFAGPEPVDLDPSRILPALSQLPDPRAKRGVRHRFAHLLVIMVCSVLAGAKSLVEMAEWASDTARGHCPDLASAPRMPRPLGRVLERLDADALDRLAGHGHKPRSPRPPLPSTVRKSAGPRTANGTRVHLLAGIDQVAGAVPAQVNVGEKTNEITRFAALLDGIGDVKGMVVTADALHTQAGHARYLAGRGAHYVLTVKGNQKNLHTQLRTQPWKQIRIGDQSRATASGREVIRTVKCISLDAGINFPHAAQAIQITRKSRAAGSGKWSTETVYAVTSRPSHRATPGQIGSWIRGHWGIENGLHWRRDVTFNEDHSQVPTATHHASWPPCAIWPSAFIDSKKQPTSPKPHARPATTPSEPCNSPESPSANDFAVTLAWFHAEFAH